MDLLFRVAPARPLRGCAGVSVLLLATLLISCDFRREQKLDIGGDTIQLARGVRIHDVAVRLVTGGEFNPAGIEVRSGDVVRFRTADSHTHVIVFEQAGLPGNARQLFAGKTQLRSPPLLVKGATWILNLDGAPPGTYIYRCVTHGVAGRFTVR